MKGIITVVGVNKSGILAKVCTYLADHNLNVLDISQTIIQGYFNMIMIVDLEGCTTDFDKIVDEMTALGQEMGVSIKVQHEDIFNCMHNI